MGLLRYAEARIEELDLGAGGPLGSEFVVAYALDDGSGAIRIGDGHGREVCRTKAEVEAALQAWVDWSAE